MSSKNGWHDAALSSHLLALIGSRWYRQQIDLLNGLNMVKMQLDDYVKCAKKIHELIRRTGVDHKGKVLSQ